MAGFVLLPVVLLLAVVGATAWLANRELGLNADMASHTLDRDKARLAAEAGLQRAVVQMHNTGCAGIYPTILTPVKDSALDGASYSAWVYTPGSLIPRGSPGTITSTGTYGSTTVTISRANVPMHQATSAALTLQPGATGVDTYLGVNNGTNYGNQTTLNAVAGQSWPLLKFDLASLPAGAHIVSATLSAYATNGSGSGNVALQRVMRDWTETGANWATADGSTAWTTAGGDLHPAAVASTAFAGSGTWLNWDVTELADKWSKGSLPNQGLQVRAPAGLSSLTLASSDHATVAYRPKLVLSYLPPCGADTVLALAPTADTDVDANPMLRNMNFGADPDMWLSRDGDDEHVLIRFDLSSIASSKTVTTATLRLYLNALPSGASTSAAMTLEAHSATKAWNELQATWVSRVTGTAWTTQGGDYTNAAAGSTVLPLGSVPGTWVEIDITALAGSWVSGGTVNNGLVLVVKNLSANQLVFSSRNNLINPPQLVVSYH
ncbi:MAG: DNRLRE domain-containing protein [Burkholderiales bacterium]|nr:DNRLRE domain-containing protein [Burkholderiales bacterium]